MTPSARSLAELKRRGYPAQVVERYNPHCRRRVDLFSVIDIVAIEPTRILGIQATGGSGNHAHRRAKILAEPRIRAWLATGAGLLIWSWNKRGARGKAKRWTLREQEITLVDFETPDEERAA